jgi:hypothetical protein
LRSVVRGSTSHWIVVTSLLASKSSIADCAVATVSGVVEATARVVVATSRVAVPTAGVVVSSARAVETAGALWIEVSAY